MIKIKILKEREKLKGGQGDNRPDAVFDPKQLAIGVEDETGEHTPSKQVGKEIAKDHLTKDPNYYRKLKAAGIDEKRNLSEVIGSLLDIDPIGAAGGVVDKLSAVGQKQIGSWFDKKQSGDQTPQTAGHGYGKDYLGRLASSMTPSEVLKRVLAALEHEKIQNVNNKNTVKAAVEELLKKETAEDADYQALTTKLAPLLTQDPKNPEAVKQRLAKAIQILKDYFARKEAPKQNGETDVDQVTPTPSAKTPSAQGEFDFSGNAKPVQTSLIGPDGKAIPAREARVNIKAMNVNFFIGYVYRTDVETLKKVFSDPLAPQSPQLLNNVIKLKSIAQDKTNQIIKATNQVFQGKPEDLIKLQEAKKGNQPLSPVQQNIQKIAFVAKTGPKEVWTVLNVLYYSGKLSKTYAQKIGLPVQAAPAPTVSAQQAIKEYLQLREEDKKAGVMMSELLKQLEAHQNKIWVFFDTETTGMHPDDRQITEIAGIAVKPDFASGNGKIIDQYHTKIDLTPETEELLKQQGDMKSTPGKMSVKDILTMNQYFTSKGDKTQEQTALSGFIDFIKKLESQGEVLLLAHNAKFDRQFISVRSAKYGLEKLNNKTIDTLDLVYEFFYPLLIVADKEKLMSKLKTARGLPSFTIGTLSSALKIDNKEWHSALADVKTLIDITQQIVSRLQKEKDVDVRAGYEKSLKLQRARKSWGKKKK